jgi:ABC-2 type transport system ATP-binding protein
MTAIASITDLRKTYDGGFEALKGVTLDIEEGEILALLGPNGAGKTTLISTVCGISNPTSGQIRVGGFDVIADYRSARALIGLVPQEVSLEPFEPVINTVRFSRGLFGKRRNDDHIERILRELSLWDKRNARIQQLSGGMKRRVLIAKALSHEPQLLFLDEPTAGVDVELRKDMWAMVGRLQRSGVTIVLTTHYIEEAEAMADRVGVISKGQLLLVEEKTTLMRRMAHKQLRVELREPMTEIPPDLEPYGLSKSDDGLTVTYAYRPTAENADVAGVLRGLSEAGIVLEDVQTLQSSLEDIFVDLVREDPR